jgi:hypothetical protein
MRTLYPILILGLALMLGQARAEEAKPAPKAGWTKTMQDLYGTLSKVLTIVSDDDRFYDSKSRRELNREVKKLTRLAHDVDRGSEKAPDRDPSVVIFGRLFADEAKYGERVLKNGYEEYARDVYRSLSGYCISCHTRTQSGPSFSSLPLNPSGNTLSAFEKGSFFAASRQYDRAMAEYDRVLADGVKALPVEWARSVKYSLAIAVRVKRDPVLTEQIIERVLKTPQAPFFLKQDAKKWLESAQAWKKERPHAGVTEDGLRAEAVRLWAEAHEFQRYPADHAADILYLRASAAVHDLLQFAPTGRYSGEAYLLAGMAYEVLSTFNIGELHEIYYEACIRNNPHTAASELCFQRFEAAVYEGFTGSGGTHLPDDLKDKLKKLEQLSQMQPKTAGMGSAQPISVSP